ncbi:hypothetical protein [Cellulomonas edaphi]|uniref:DUF3040 domain-containing protein n=1 Tax=Cellulomonas edaphi TaxID=3053468 RepID=A0ABT7S705_9CELL|nr:hypothetical protein [Cellulomons edaphi]MDM7831403.1 hypothetical protein [Cellulomons edaphi]
MAPRPDDPDEPALGPDADVPGPEDIGSSAHADDPATPAPDGPPERAPEVVDDEQWAAIVAQLGEVDSTDAPSRPALDFPVAPWVEGAHVVRPAEQAPAGRDWDGTSQYDDAEAAVDEADSFVPPDPGPVLGGDPLLTMAWFAAAGMPLFLLVVLVAWRDAPAALVQAACAVFVLGVAALVWRMPHRRDPDDDDTGAVV